MVQRARGLDRRRRCRRSPLQRRARPARRFCKDKIKRFGLLCFSKRDLGHAPVSVRRSVLTAAQMTSAEVSAFLRTELPQMFNYDDLTIKHADGQTCQITQRFRESMLRPGSTISGPSLIALAHS